MMNRVSLDKWGTRKVVDGILGEAEPISLLRFLWSIKCTPEQSDDAEGSDSDLPTAVETEDTSDLTNDLSSAKSNKSTPQYQKQREEFERRVRQLATQDLKRKAASGMFTIIEPSSEPDIWLFAVRKKYSSVATRVLNDLVAFLIYFLQEETITREDFVLRKWVDTSQLAASRERGKTWVPGENAAVSQVELTEQMDLGMGFLDELGMEDPIPDTFHGAVTIDLNMADVRSIDEGATIIGLLNEQMRLKQAQEELTDALTTIAQERREKQAQAQRIAELEAQMALLQNMSVQTPAKKPQAKTTKKTQAKPVTPATPSKPKGQQKSSDGGSTKVDSGGSSSARRP